MSKSSPSQPITICLPIPDLRGPTGAAEEEQDAADKRGEEEDGGDKGPEPHLLLQLALGKELARSNRWEFATFQKRHVPLNLTEVSYKSFLQNHWQQKITVNANLAKNERKKVINEHSRLLTI